MTSLEALSTQALLREETQPAIEFQHEWRTWGEIRHVAERLAKLIDASGAEPHAAIAFVPRNRPSAIAALLGLIAQGRTVRMLYAFQSSTALAQDVERLRPAILVAAAEDYSEELVSVLRAHGVAALALVEMDATALPGLAQSRRETETP